MNDRLTECKSAAVTLSDMELFVFPELMYSLVLANSLSPRIWRWREDPWFDKLAAMRPYKRVQRIKQFIMDHYIFNLDLETWGLTRQQRELQRFRPFLSPEGISRSNALFGYQGDSYYFDIGIRKHFGLDKYDSDVIPYWKTETVEAMDAFRHKDGFTTGAGECVSLAALYAAALFIVGEIPLEDIFLMATPLHSQNFILLGEGILTNNRRIVTKPMWFNGTQISAQARRALEHERVTIVSHCSGWIHLLYPHASIDRIQYERFGKTLRAYLTEDCADLPAHADGNASTASICPDITIPQLPDEAAKTFVNEEEPLDIRVGMSRTEIRNRLESIRGKNQTADMAFYAFRDLSCTEADPFFRAALERNPVCVKEAEPLDLAHLLRMLASWPNRSIYDEPERVAQPDEVWNFRRGDGLEKALVVAAILASRQQDAKNREPVRLQIADGFAVLMQAGKTRCAFPSAKTPKDVTWSSGARSDES